MSGAATPRRSPRNSRRGPTPVRPTCRQHHGRRSDDGRRAPRGARPRWRSRFRRPERKWQTGSPSHHGRRKPTARSPSVSTTSAAPTPDYPQMAADTRTGRTRAAAGPRLSSAPSWSSTRRRRATCGRCRTTRSTTSRSPTSAPSYLRDENHPQKVQFGPSRTFSLVGDGQTHESAVRVFDADGDGPVAGLVRFDWDRAELVRGGRADLRPSPQPVCRGSMPCARTARHRRTRRRGARRHQQSGAAVRNRFADKVLHRRDRRRLRAPGAVATPRRCARTRA